MFTLSLTFYNILTLGLAIPDILMICIQFADGNQLCSPTVLDLLFCIFFIGLATPGFLVICIQLAGDNHSVAVTMVFLTFYSVFYL